MCLSQFRNESCLIENIDKKKIVVGMKQTLSLIAKEELGQVFIALDADSFVTSEIIEAAEDKGIPIHYVESMKRLGKEVGIDIGASCAGVLNKLL